MRKTVAYIFIMIGLATIAGCSSNGGNGALKTISKLLGGQPDQSVFKETTVKEALEYEYRVCLGDYEGQQDKMKECVEEAYAKVVEEKGIGERPTDGEVIIKDVSDDEVINEDSDSDTDDASTNENDDS
ncbi:hypothetical protein DZA50_06140 [Kangiella sp. HD9-110m-PIT-SAG07]|nr:hypothetical protein DZA50_06140 [Kangiella sp. HD9-110m-PIT-SAG07]